MKILVFGATGKQGGRVARHLLKKRHTVHALTRNPNSPSVKELEKNGAKVIGGDFNDPSSIERAVQEVDAIFAMTTPFEGSPEKEVQHGSTIADIAKEKGKYLVFSSVAQADQETGIPHFDTKGEIEKHIKEINVTAAVIAPVYFMENLISMGLDALKEGKYTSPLKPHRKLAQIALDDLAAFATLALENKERFVGKRVDIASDELSGKETVHILSKVIGKPIKYEHVSMEEICKISDDLAKMYEWFERVGYSVDIKKLRQEYPEIPWHTFESWAQEQNWSALLGEKTTAKR